MNVIVPDNPEPARTVIARPMPVDPAAMYGLVWTERAVQCCAAEIGPRVVGVIIERTVLVGSPPPDFPIYCFQAASINPMTGHVAMQTFGLPGAGSLAEAVAMLPAAMVELRRVAAVGIRPAADVPASFGGPRPPKRRRL